MRISKTISGENKIIKVSTKETWEDVLDIALRETIITEEVDEAIEKQYVRVRLARQDGSEVFDAEFNDFVQTIYEFEKS